jgi:hypothetical protein
MNITALDSEKEHLKEALDHYESVLVILDRFELELPYDDNEFFPEDWPEDPLVLFGQYLEILALSETEEDEFRYSVIDMVESNGAEWFWGNRMRLAAEIEFVRRL